jgi:hypothetical protein
MSRKANKVWNYEFGSGFLLGDKARQPAALADVAFGAGVDAKITVRSADGNHNA